MTRRFDRPAPGSPTPIHFPAIVRTTLDNGLAVWAISHGGVPAVSMTLLVPRGTGDDPGDRHGLASLAGDLLDEGAGSRDAIELAESFSRLGTQVDIDVGPDVTSISASALSRFTAPVLELIGDVAMRPRLAEPDFRRVRELRLNRLRQLSRSAATMADRAYVSALFPSHSYGHGALGTSASLATITLDETRDFWARMFGPAGATLIIVGDIEPDEAFDLSSRLFGAWRQPSDTTPRTRAPESVADARVLLVDRPGAPQSELRVGHVGPPRRTDAYPALVTVNAVLGGQFTSRINRRLREEKGVTYGARTSFDFRRVAGTFSCDTSVQADATGSAVADILSEFAAIGQAAVPEDELSIARASLTRGYVRNFETAGQIARAAAQLATYELDDGTFDRFVSSVESVTPARAHAAAQAFIRPAEATVVVVGDAATCREPLEALGRPLVLATPEF
jgi:predicted Zn-dependent peptidase